MLPPALELPVDKLNSRYFKVEGITHLQDIRKNIPTVRKYKR